MRVSSETELIVPETGLLDFDEVPVSAELFVKDRWSALKPFEGAEQANTMPDD